MKYTPWISIIPLVACGLIVGFTETINGYAQENPVSAIPVSKLILEKELPHGNILKISQKKIPYVPPDNIETVRLNLRAISKRERWRCKWSLQMAAVSDGN